MKNFTPFLLILFSLFFSYIAIGQYKVGEFVNDTIYTGNFYSMEDCAPDPDVSIEIDAPLLSYVSGLELKIVITELNAPAGSISTENGVLSIGDTLAINAEENLYSFYFTEGGNFHFILLARGTPEVEGESYPCELMEFISLPLCDVGYIIVADDFAGNCMVEEGDIVSIEELIDEDQFLLFPNPAESIITLQNNTSFSIQNISIYNAQGQTVSINGSSDLQIDLSAYSPGIYWIKIRMEEQDIFKKLVKL